ncbi:sensor histidine kinase [Paenibacillus gansuensis]|uniref:Sensor histidine kinase n=1 Tax=Paenibacillus gansuensis TaxID=306542 RepID=A0ABW5PAY0_9BACL
MRRMDIYKRIVLLLFSMLVPILTLFGYLNSQTVMLMENQLKESNLNKLTFFLTQLETNADKMSGNLLTLKEDRDVLQFVNSYSFEGYTKARTKLDVENKLAIQSLASSWKNRIAVYVLSTGQTASSDSTATPADLRGRKEYPKQWKLVRSGEQSYFTRYLTDSLKANGEPGKANVVMEVRFSIENIRTMLKQYQEGGSGDPFMLFPGGVEITNSSGNANLAEITRRLDPGAMNERGYTTMTFGGETYLVTYIHSPKLGGYLVDYLPTAEFLAPIEKQRILFYSFGGLLLATSVMAAWLLYRHVQLPIRQLLSGVQGIKDGRYSIRVARKAKTEFDFLFKRFNEMAEQIQELIEHVYEEKLRSRDAKVKQLQSQINPHFLYNCFAHIIQMTRLGREEAVIAMSHNLCDYYRYTTRIEKPLANLKEEVEFIENYLEIQKMRMTRMRYELVVEERLLEFPLPRLSLQPIVENAIIHGLEPKESPGWIRICARQQGDSVLITVSDDGVGMDVRRLEELNRSIQETDRGEEGGCGLSNTHQRLRLHYGADSGIVLAANQEEEGMRVEVRIHAGSGGAGVIRASGM